MWNERQLDTTPFLVSTSKFLLKYATDYNKCGTRMSMQEKLRDFFQTEYRHGDFSE